MTIERSLGGLLSPFPLASFFADHWEQTPLHISRHDAGAYGGIMGLDDFEALVAATPVDHHWIGVDAAVSAVFLDEGRAEHRYQLRTDIGHRPRLSAVHEALSRGHSIAVRHVRKSWGPVADLCAGVEQGLQHVVHCNAFLTPPCSRAYPPHFDVSDTFFLQLAGSKTWRIAKPEVSLPPLGLSDNQAADVEVSLQQGDALFLPRGWVHHAVAGSEPSLHITIGTDPVRWLDVAIEFLKSAAVTDLRLRESVSFDFPETAQAERVIEILQGLRLGSEHNESQLASIRARLLEAQPDLHTPLAAQVMGPDAGLDTIVRHRPGLGLVVTTDTSSVRLSGIGSFVAGPLEALSAFEYIAKHRSFVVSDLPSVVADETKMAVVNELLRQGLLMR